MLDCFVVPPRNDRWLEDLWPLITKDLWNYFTQIGKVSLTPMGAPRPYEGRLGIRNLDFTERQPLYDTYKRIHSQKYQLRVQALEENKNKHKKYRKTRKRK